MTQEEIRAEFNSLSVEYGELKNQSAFVESALKINVKKIEILQRKCIHPDKKSISSNGPNELRTCPDCGWRGWD